MSKSSSFKNNLFAHIFAEQGISVNNKDTNTKKSTTKKINKSNYASKDQTDEYKKKSESSIKNKKQSSQNNKDNNRQTKSSKDLSHNFIFDCVNYSKNEYQEIVDRLFYDLMDKDLTNKRINNLDTSKNYFDYWLKQNHLHANSTSNNTHNSISVSERVDDNDTSINLSPKQNETEAQTYDSELATDKQLDSSKKAFVLTGNVAIQKGGFGFVKCRNKLYYLPHIDSNKILHNTTISFYSLNNDSKDNSIRVYKFSKDWYNKSAEVVSITPCRIKFNSDDRTFLAHIPGHLSKNVEVGSIFLVKCSNFDSVSNSELAIKPEFILTTFIGKNTDKRIEWTRVFYEENCYQNLETDYQSTFDEKLISNTYHDLTGLEFVSIDNETTKEIDDLIYCKELTSPIDASKVELKTIHESTIYNSSITEQNQFTGYSYTLSNCEYSIDIPVDTKFLSIVAISDPTHFIKLNSRTIVKALELNTSCYLPDYTVNMLPEELVQEIATLSENNRKPAIVYISAFNESGELLLFKPILAIVKSKAKLSYLGYQQYLDSNFSEAKDLRYSLNVDVLKDLYKFYKIRNKWRKSQFTYLVNFQNKPNYEFDDNNNCINISKKEELETFNIISECMLIVNQYVCEFMSTRNIPALYSTQDGIKIDKDFSLLTYTGKLIKDKNISLLDQFKDLSESELLQINNFRKLRSILSELDPKLLDLMNRRMLPSNFSIQPSPHLGLGTDKYLTITSPLRRFADLHNEINLKAYLSGGSYINVTQPFADYCNTMKGQFKAITKQFIMYLEHQYLSQESDKTYRANVSMITDRGAYINLCDSGISCFINSSYLFDDGKSQNQVIYNSNDYSLSSNEDVLKLHDVIETKCLQSYPKRIFKRYFKK